MASPALQVAEHALLEERRSLTRDEVGAVAALPLDELPDLIALAHKVRLAYCGPDVELESLINAKSGACPEDCAFCSQSVKFDTGVDVYPFLDLDEVVEAARATRAAGATQFCIVVAVRGPSERLLDKVIDAVDAVHERDRARGRVLARAARPRPRPSGSPTPGVRRYNHNLEAPREVFPSICTTHTYEDRVATARLASRRGHGAVLRRHPRHGRDARAAHRLRVRARRARPVRGADQLPPAQSGTPLGEQRLITPARSAAVDRAVPARAAERVAPPRRRT